MATLVTVGELLDHGWKTMHAHWRPTLKYTLWIILLPVILNILLVLLTAVSPELRFDLRFQLVHALVFGLAILIPSIKLYRYLLAVDRAPTVKPNTSITAQDLLQIVLILTVTMIAVMGGFLLLILPGVWLSQMLAFGLVSYLEDGKTGLDAIKESWKLVNGRWWAVFLRTLIPSLLIGAGIGFVVMTLMLFIIFVGGLLAGGGLFLFSAFAHSVPAVNAVLIVVGVLVGVGLAVGSFVCYAAAVIVSQLFTSAIYVRLFHSLKQTAS